MFGKMKHLFTSTPLTADEQFAREWDNARRTATTPSELSEIDAIFSRASH